MFNNPNTAPVAMLQTERETWAMVIPALVIPELGTVAVNVVWDLKVSAN